MKIQNKNVSVELARKALDCVPFVLDVISVCKPCQMDTEQPICKEPLSVVPFWELNTHDYNDVANMIHALPIYLVKGKGEEYPEDKLGAYCASKGSTSPYIKLYVEEIEKASAANAVQFQWLFTKVLLHEVMHAIMDVYNQIGFAGRETQFDSGEYRKWREESYANGGALWIIREYAKLHPSQENDDFVQYIERFMIMNQNDGYTLGIHVADFPVCYMRHWIDEKMGKKYLVEEYEKWCNPLSKNDKANLKLK